VDLGLVGGKSFGIRRLIEAGVAVPPGFAVTTEAFSAFLEHNRLKQLIARLKENSRQDLPRLKTESENVQRLVLSGTFPDAVGREINGAVRDLEGRMGAGRRFAVRSSCDYEDLQEMSFAGVYQSFINASAGCILANVLGCYGSLYSVRSILYMLDHNLDIEAVHMGVLIQESVEAECAGTLFTADANSGFTGVHKVEAVWGLGEGIVSGKIVPNSWTIFKENNRIIGRTLGNTMQRYVAQEAEGVECVNTPEQKRDTFCLTDAEVEQLAHYATRLEEQEGQPLDIEWVKSTNNELLLLQVRPLKVYSDGFFSRYTILSGQEGKPLLRGMPITDKVVSGKVRIAEDGRCDGFTDDILVVKYIDLDSLPFLRNVKGIIVEGGGYTSHIAIILREHGIPAILGAEGAREKLAEGQTVTLVCGEGSVWAGELDFSRDDVDIGAIRKPRHTIGLVASALASIDHYLRLPVDGIGLVRLEFIVYERIGIHPLALIDYDAGVSQDPALKAAIEERTRGFKSKREFYIQKLAEGICAFACRCRDRFVNVRVPDFITGDYLMLLGGREYEPYTEANPMMGWRGTSRLIDEEFRAAFEMDCEAFRRAIDDYGFSNVNILVPFCRVPEDGRLIKSLLREKGPVAARIGMMVEIPSNVMLAKKFAEIFDFFLVGPMDLTQLTYGADRLSLKMSKYCNETEAVKEMVKYFLHSIREHHKDVFIGGWPLFQHVEEYDRVKGNVRLHMVELPDRLLELFDNVNRLEDRLEVVADGDREQLYQ
jgi:pyruvate,water dikinase